MLSLLCFLDTQGHPQARRCLEAGLCHVHTDCFVVKMFHLDDGFKVELGTIPEGELPTLGACDAASAFWGPSK